MRLTPLRLRHMEVAAILLILVGVGVVHFARLTPGQALAVELEAGMEQLHQLEADHFARHRQYFDPEAPDYRPYLTWLDRREHEVRWTGDGYAVTVRADLDGDGQSGVWRVDDAGPEVERLVED